MKIRSPLTLVTLVLVAGSSLAGDPQWARMSTTTGELENPNPGNQQTCNVVADFDGDGRLDILMKPYNHNAPRVDVLLNRAP